MVQIADLKVTSQSILLMHPCSHLAIIVVAAATAHVTIVHASGHCVLSSVWHDLVHFQIGPSPHDCPPVEASESIDEDEATVQESKIDNDFVFNLFFVVMILIIV